MLLLFIYVIIALGFSFLCSIAEAVLHGLQDPASLPDPDIIAADIIKTVTVDPTLENTATLGLLVLIRTFLSWSIVVEVTGRWPWEEPLGDPSQ